MFFARRSGKAVFLARFVMSERPYGALAAGMSRVLRRTFFFYSILGAVGWDTSAVSLGYFLWAALGLVEHRLGPASVLLAVLLVAGGVI